MGRLRQHAIVPYKSLCGHRNSNYLKEFKMGTLLILLIGISVVVGSILFFKMHAFLALVLGALLVAFLTPAQDTRQYLLERDSTTISAIENETQLTFIATSKSSLSPGESVLIYSRADGIWTKNGQAQVQELDGTQSTATVTESLTKSVNAGDLLVSYAVEKSSLSASRATIGQRVSQGFGSTCAKIGILIAMASIIGKCLLESGAAERVVRSALKLTGEKGAPVAFIGSGFLLAIPVFFDTVFYLMIPLGKALRLRTKKNYLLYVLTIVAGGTMAHSLVPPTPGPLFVAEELGVSMGLMMIAGCIVGLMTAIYGFIHATVINRYFELPLRETSDTSLEDLEKISQRDDAELPSLLMSVLPIILPVFLIGGYTIARPWSSDLPSGLMATLKTLGDKNIALTISAAIALGTLIRQKQTRLGELSQSIQSALASGGVIILITAAGGAFGRVLQETGVSNLIRDLPGVSPVMVVTLAFLITTAIRTAQGSSTVAMITAVGVLSGIANSGDLPFHPVYLAMAIGCGSKPIAWMNDSGFWVITRMSGMTEAEGLKFVTPLTLMMGIVGLLTTIVGVLVWPMV